MKVIGAGFGRTGTMSLKVALEELGAGPCFHCLDPSALAAAIGAEQAPIDGQPVRLAETFDNGSQVDWRTTLAGWGSTVGWLGARFYQEMLDAWPDALVLLSVRDQDAWYTSCCNSFYAARDASAAATASEPRNPGASGVHGSDENHGADERHGAGPNGDHGTGVNLPDALVAPDGPIWGSIFEGRFAERDHALRLYRRHNEQVMSTVPRERLLVYEVEQGWEPLCDFLGVQSPAVPFPHLNRAASLPAGPASARLSRSSSLRRGESRYARQLARAPRPALRTGPRITGLALADSPQTFSQDEVLKLLGLAGDEFAERIFRRSGVQRRHLNLTPAFLADTLQGRGLQVEEELMAHSIAAVDQLQCDADTIGTVISASLYSLGCPTLAHRLVDHYAMDPATDKYHITGVGCASAVPLLRLAAQALREHPGKQALVVAAESMSSIMMHATPEDPRAKTVGSAIFGDGCAAALLSNDRDATGPMILASQVHQIGGTLEAVSLALSPADSHLHLARELPDLAGAGLDAVVSGFLERNRVKRAAIDHWLVHPGGRRIIESVQSVLGLTDDDVAVSWKALADHGNIGTPSILYVLQETLAQRQPRPGERGMMVTIGPGVSVGLMLLQF